MTYTWDTLPEPSSIGVDPIELTDREIYENTQLSDTQKSYINRMATFAKRLGLTIWFNPEMPNLYLAKGNDIFSELLDMNDRCCLSNLVSMLELMCALQGMSEQSAELVEPAGPAGSTESTDEQRPGTKHQPAVASDLTLEQRVEALERLVYAKDSDYQKARFDELARRARKIGNTLFCNKHGRYDYRRYRTKIEDLPSSHYYFVTQDAYDPTWRDRQNQHWFFNAYELDILEAFIAHDEEIYARYQH